MKYEVVKQGYINLTIRKVGEIIELNSTEHAYYKDFVKPVENSISITEIQDNKPVETDINNNKINNKKEKF